MVRLLVSLGALAVRASAQQCTTTDTYTNGGLSSLPADCGAILATGLSCEDLACYAPSVGDNGLPAAPCAIQNPGGFAGQCSLTCGHNVYDGVFGEGACDRIIAAGARSCAQDYVAGGNSAGDCDFACGFCTADPAPAPLPPPPPPSATCATIDALDANSAPGACSAHLGDGTFSCDDAFSGGGLHAGQCNLACQLNILEHPLAYMPAANLAPMAGLFEPVYAVAGASDAASFVPLMAPGLCQTLIEAAAAAGNDLCSAFLNIALPASFGGQGACDFACNRCHSVGTYTAPESALCQHSEAATSNWADDQYGAGECEAMVSTGVSADGSFDYGCGGGCSCDLFGPGQDFDGQCNLHCNFDEVTVVQADAATCAAQGDAWVVTTPPQRNCDTPDECCTNPGGEDAPQCSPWITAFGGVADDATHPSTRRTCLNVFALDRARAGQCDFACGYCESEPVPCVGEWGAWGDCSEPCGTGTQSRSYSVSIAAANGGAQCEAADGAQDSQDCNTDACPPPPPPPPSPPGTTTVSGEMSFAATMAEVDADRAGFEAAFRDAMAAQFSSSGVAISADDVTVTSIVGGSVIVSYSVDVPCDGDCSAAATSAAAANDSALAAAEAGSLAVGEFASEALATAVDCEGDWGEWGDCSELCGGGTQSRAYEVSTAAANGGQECPDPESQGCNTAACAPRVSPGATTESNTAPPPTTAGSSGSLRAWGGAWALLGSVAWLLAAA